ncbi:unnamed protein product [Mytilus coruscus]|uniref:Endonuclease/exonuclease/phosphatase domain-containing protein n=1 Tax=Mytilus coruscus TaxID=42192 RepID=A0A6J8CA20_MYTCO|nr:unnamed protein product [Mytilus coruscus]
MKYTLLLSLASSLVLYVINAHIGSSKQNPVNLLNPILHHSGKRPISLPVQARQNITTMLLIILLLGDIEINPGPKTANVFPCGLCERPVTWSREGKDAQDPDAQKQLINITTQFGLTQFHEEPTRENNLLDLVFTTNPSLTKTSTNIPGISDHAIIKTDTDIKPFYSKSNPRKVFNWEEVN